MIKLRIDGWGLRGSRIDKFFNYLRNCLSFENKTYHYNAILTNEQ
jgi:hypothetical protein